MPENNIQKHTNKKLIFFNDAVEYFDKYGTQDLLNNHPTDNLKDNRIQKHTNKKLVFFNDAVEYFDKYSTQELLNNQQINNLEDNNPNLLRDLMLIELNHLRDLIINSQDSKLEALSEKEREIFYRFIKFYSECPICGNLNHYYNLKKFYFDKKSQNLKESLIKLMNSKNKKLYTFELNIGIPCCNCYKRFKKQ